MKIIFIGLICLLITGCDSHVYSHEMAGYEKACKEHGGVAKINNFSRIASCADGARVRWYIN